MKIVYVYKSIALLAGMERVLTDKMNYLSEQLGYDVYLITYEQGSHPFSYSLSSRIKSKDLGILFYTNSKLPFFKRIVSYWKMRKMFKLKLYNEVRAINPDVVIATNYSYPQLDILSNIPGKNKLILETHLSKKAVLKSSEFKGMSLAKLMAYVYDYYMISRIKKFDYLVTLTEEDKKAWKNIANTIVIPNVLTLYPQEVAVLKAKKIISVGRLDPQKGYDLLIQAWSSVAAKRIGWQMHIYGNGPCKDMLQKQIEAAGLDTSFFLHDATPDIYAKYNEHSIYVMSSRFEGFGLVLIEAMSCGVPCISFDCPSGPSEIIKDGDDGILVENGNINKLSEAICRLIDDEKERRQMGAKARESSLRYSKENVMRRWDALFKGNFLSR